MCQYCRRTRLSSRMKHSPHHVNTWVLRWILRLTYWTLFMRVNHNSTKTNEIVIVHSHVHKLKYSQATRQRKSPLNNLKSGKFWTSISLQNIRTFAYCLSFFCSWQQILSWPVMVNNWIRLCNLWRSTENNGKPVSDL